MMHSTGRYKLINLIFGFFPFIGAMLITLMKPDSPPAQLWLSIVRFPSFPISPRAIHVLIFDRFLWDLVIL